MKHLRKEELLAIILTAIAILFIIIGIYRGLWQLSTVLSFIPEIILASLVPLILWGFKKRIWKPSDIESITEQPRSFGRTDSLSRRQEEYKNHSLQLVDEIPKWLDLRNFDECSYAEDGVRFEKGIEYYEPLGVPYLDYLKLHIEAAYPEIMDLYNKIKKNHADWSQKIKEIMSGQDAPYNPSFEKIIIDNINNSCPKLNRSKDTGLSQNNIYIAQSVFNILFKALYNNLQLDLLEVKSSGSTSQLEYDHNKIIAQGDEIYMYKLKEEMNDLVKDQGLKNIIQYYKEMEDSLRRDEDFTVLKFKLMNLYHLVKGGKTLGGDGACDLCPH